jgi:hypothetical protein
VNVKLVDGMTQLEARSDDNGHFRVTCRQLNLQSPNGTVQAQGEVKVSGSDLNGTCDTLTISWQKESILMEGKVHLKCPKDGQEIELDADRLSIKLSTIQNGRESAWLKSVSGWCGLVF